MSKQNNLPNTNRQQRKIIRGSPPTPDGTFDLRNTPSANQEPQRINFAPPQLIYPNQPYYPQPYNNPPFAPPQQQSAFNPYGQPNMYGHYDYGAHHNFGGSSSQPNFGDSSSHPNIGGSLSQPNVCEEADPKKRPQKKKAVDQRCIPWTPEKKTALCKGWVRTSEDSVKGNMRNERGFCIDILKYTHETYPITHRRTYDVTYTSGASDSDYLQKALTHYQAEYGVPFTLLYCWKALKDSEKWRSGEIPKFMQERQDGMNKRYKSSGSSSFNTKDSGEGSINLNTTVGTEDENEMEKVQEVRRPKPMGTDQAKRKLKGGSATSASLFDVRELAKMMASEYVMASDPYNTQKNQEMSELLKIKNRELELKAAELEIRRMENRQRDEALYETTTDEALKERLRQRLSVDFTLYALNRGLMIKWVWRFYFQKNSLWTKVIKAIYGEDGNLNKVSSGGVRTCWSSIVQEVRVLQGGVIKDLFPRMFALETNKNASVSLKLNAHSLDNSFRRQARSGIEVMQLNSLAEIPRRTTLVPCEDHFVWTLEGDGVFSVASIRKKIDGNRFQYVCLPTRWVKSVPIKVNITAWKVKSNAFLTRFNISRRGMDIDSMVCPICNTGVETTNHIFFQCVVVRQIMRKISSWWNIDYSDVNSYKEWRVWLVSIRIQSKLKGILEGVYYGLW
nr:RNA-directed DNA polymerase, eukaryota [Tanacetum cinerariifolium]